MMDIGAKRPLSDIENVPLQHPMPHLPVIVPPQSPPAQSSPGSMTDAGSSTPARNSPSPNLTPTRPQASTGTPAQPQQQHLTPSQLQISIPAANSSQPDAASGQPPAKRKKLTQAEKDEKAKADAAKKQERDQAKAARDAEKARIEAEKKARAEEREKKRKEKEEEDRKKNEEKERKRREKEEEERKIQEAKDKKERSQMRLNSFFKTGPSTPAKKANETLQNGSPVKTPQKAKADEVSEYEKLFQPFFVKDQVSLGRGGFVMDDETKEAKSRILDEHISEKRGLFTTTKFTSSSTVDYFHLPSLPPRRGRQYPSVRKIVAAMSDMGTSSMMPVDLTTESHNAQIKMARELLKRVPMKFLSFREDVRPPYCGTVTSVPPHASLNKLARNPMSKQVLPLNYEYDSEAEWVDDGDGEDVDLLDDDDEDLDDDEEMGDFLDDENDQGPLRHAFMSGMEPESTGLCWENQKRLGPLPHMYKFRTEFILDTLQHHSGIDPFSTKYWEPEVPKSKATANDQANHTISTDTSKPMAPPPNRTDAFAALTSGSSKPDPKTAQIPPEMVQDFKETILKYEKLSKVGLVEILSTEFPKCTKIQIKNSVESLAERVGKGPKLWKLKA
ncbi:uncharacterized protein E0L32_008884 [Thyridium curvatum]|uniref:Chromatin assembly factor 1 subunit A n=1 Tax=Thyridium curvatum TaxID=1093900 RepID=A0A507AK26_9PEZI|nr:uncharacterized protein E0L32_008884 [Thyridium curvatum]TPX09862.1 hypothetical protein E0L32_008884 [Thyridium curvatum]